MKTTRKKLVSGLLAGLFIMTIGAVLVTADTEEKTEETNPLCPFEEHHGMNGFGPFDYNLTDDQQAELEDLLETLRQENATREEMKNAIQEKLDEFGVLDIQLDNEIEQTEQELAILNRQKELREQGYSWDEISIIIEEEFDTVYMSYIGGGMMHGPGFGREPHEFISSEEIEQ